MRNTLLSTVTAASVLSLSVLTAAKPAEAVRFTDGSVFQITADVLFSPLVPTPAQGTGFSFQKADGTFAPIGSYGNFGINSFGTTGNFEPYEALNTTISPVSPELEILSLRLPSGPVTFPVAASDILPDATTNPFLRVTTPITTYTEKGNPQPPLDNFEYFITSLNSLSTIPPVLPTPPAPGTPVSFVVELDGFFRSPEDQSIAPAILSGTFIRNADDPQRANFIGSFVVQAEEVPAVPEPTGIAGMVLALGIGSATLARKRKSVS